MRSLMVIFLLFCYACVTSGKGNVVFMSKNFTNILTWDPAEPRVLGQEVRYSVFYERDTDKNNFLEKAECQNITELFCDLTSETPAVYDLLYRARVWADGSHHGQTKTFKPVAETVLGAPILSLHTTTTSLHLDVTLPLGPNRESITDILKRIKKGPSSSKAVVYNLYITQPSWAAQEIENTTGHFMVNLKNDQTKYCGHVLYKPAFEWGRPPSENSSFCVTLPGNPWIVLPWPIMAVAVVAVVVAVAVCCVRSKLKEEEKTPQSLIFDKKLSNGDCSKDENIVYDQIQKKPSATFALDGYAYNNTSCQEDLSLDTAEGRSQELRYVEDSSQSSDLYGAVAVQVEDGRDLHQLQSDRPDRMCHGAGLGHYEAKPLLLETWRGSNGQLILPMPPFEVQKTFSGTIALPSAETKPLLSYLILSEKRPSVVSLNSLDSSEFSDSGCDENIATPTNDYSNSHYLATQQVLPQFRAATQRSLSADSGTYDSAYKHNWLPALISGSSTDTCNYGNTNYTWTWSGLKEEGESKDEKKIQE